ncbi:hypothetical protein OH492_22825 [Vibrio chagasii]|nr:hypothetical protein [Vibrio chagasii]
MWRVRVKSWMLSFKCCLEVTGSVEVARSGVVGIARGERALKA